MNIDALIQLETKELFALRERLHKEQNGICPILKQKFPVDMMVVDHQHRRSNSKIGKNGGGLIRGVIHRQINSYEGKVSKNFIRTGLAALGFSLPEVLRALADYYEREALPYVHPNEKPRGKTLGKQLFNKISKAYSIAYPKRKPLEYPQMRGPKKTKPPLLTAKWIELIKELNIKE